MTPIITKISRKQARQILKYRMDGYSCRAVGGAMGIPEARVAKYERLLDMYGLDAFATKSAAERARIDMRKERLG